MPKMKTHKGLKKRVRITANGKVKHKNANAGHLMSGKSAKRRRRIKKDSTMFPVFAKEVLVLLGGKR
jgi:large subunit ribosomal protein L35